MEHDNRLPDFFEPLLAEQYSNEDVERIVAGCSARRSVTLRANTLKATREEVARALDEAGIDWETVPWYGDAFVLPAATERDVWQLPAYERGEVYLQSLSSMIPALVLNAQAGDDVCDLCAAPGGKTTQIAALSAAPAACASSSAPAASGGAYITACELHAPRAEKLEYNLRKLGARGVTVMRCDARKLDEFFSFDRILLDAPCSGSGTLVTGDAKTRKRFTTKLIEKSVKSQRALIAKALSLLRPGGTLVYSTCSVLARENEDIVRWGLEHAPRGKSFNVKPIELANADDLPRLPSSLEGALTLCPTNRYEGFFVAKVQRIS